VTLAAAGGPPAEVLIDSTHMKAHRSAPSGKGRSPPGDRRQPWRPDEQASRAHRRRRTAVRFLLTPTNAAEAKAALQLLDALPARAVVLADKAYEGGAIRA
jgi:hypothetical protein